MSFTYSDMVIAESIMTVVGFIVGFFLHDVFIRKKPNSPEVVSE